MPILISDSFYEMLDDEDRVEIREIDIVTVKGKTQLRYLYARYEWI
ncbi:MAG: hypothetical protein IPL26_22030 [Leptospiraceae bacterium]|nr:hypothetical protein [Leptospiraceae bacterium]